MDKQYETDIFKAEEKAQTVQLLEYHVSLQYETELAKFKRKELPLFLIMVSVLTRGNFSIKAICVLFFI